MLPAFITNNPTILRAYILYEYLQGSSVEESYKKVSKVMGNVDYVDFEYWYYRFHQKKYNFNHNKRIDLKNRTFSELPIDIVQKILDELEFVDRMSLRKVSHGLRDIINKQSAKCRRISIMQDYNQFLLQFDKCQTLYLKEESDCRMVIMNKGQKVINGNYMEIAFNDISFPFNNPKFELRTLNINLRAKGDQETMLHRFLSQFESKLHVKRVKLMEQSFESAVKVLKCLKPETLEKIEIGFTAFSDADFEEITEMDQWKKAKIVKLSLVFGISSVQLSKLHHFHIFKAPVIGMTLVDLVYLLTDLSKSNDFQICKIMLWKPHFTVLDIGIVFGVDVFNDHYIKIKFRIPESKEFLELTMSFMEIWIKRKQ